MPLHEYGTKVIVTLFVMCLMTIYVIVLSILIWAIRICEQTHIAVLFAIWSVLCTPYLYKHNQWEDGIGEKLLKAQRKRQRMPNTVGDKQKETKWLNTLSITHRLIAIRLLSVDVDDIHDSDKHFLQQVALLPGGAPDHVCRRRSICSEQLRRIESGQSRICDSENQSVLWLIAFAQSAMGFAFVRGAIAVLAMTELATGEPISATEYFTLLFETLSDLMP